MMYLWGADAGLAGERDSTYGAHIVGEIKEYLIGGVEVTIPRT